MPGTFFPPPQVSDPDMHLGTCVTHVLWSMPRSLTSVFLWSQRQGKRSRHSRPICNPQFSVSGKRHIKLLALHPIVQVKLYWPSWIYIDVFARLRAVRYMFLLHAWRQKNIFNIHKSKHTLNVKANPVVNNYNTTSGSFCQSDKIKWFGIPHSKRNYFQNDRSITCKNPLSKTSAEVGL